MDFKDSLRPTAIALAFLTGWIAHAKPVVRNASPVVLHAASAPVGISASVTSPLGTQDSAVKSFPTHGMVNVHAWVLGNMTGDRSVYIDGVPGNLSWSAVTDGPPATKNAPKSSGTKQNISLIYWALSDAGRIRMTIILSGASDGDQALAVYLKYGETKSIQLYDASGTGIAGLRMIAPKN